MVTQAIGLDDQTERGPEEVHPETLYSLLGLWEWESRSANQLQEPALQLRVGEAEGLSVKQPAQRLDAIRPAAVIDVLLELLGIDQAELVRGVHSCLQLTWLKNGGEIDEGPRRGRCRDPFALGELALTEFSASMRLDSV